MNTLGRSRIVAALLLIAAISGTSSSAQAQFEVMPAMEPGDVVFPTQGFWAEVVTVTPKWLVVQNYAGQQFPISVQGVGELWIRQSINANEIAQGAMVETIGIEGVNERIVTDHIDVYDANLKSIAVAGTQLITGSGQVTNEFWMTFGFSNGFIFPPSAADLVMPTRRRIVGPAVGLADGLHVAVDGNRSVTLVAAPGGLAITLLSQARSFGEVQPKDIAFVVLNPRAPFSLQSLNVAQMVVYRGFR